MDENMNNANPMNNDMEKLQPEGSMGMSIAGMVLGIVSIICCGIIGIICGIIGVILSALALKDNKPGRGMAIAGVACSVVGIVGGIIYLIFYATSVVPLLNFKA